MENRVVFRKVSDPFLVRDRRAYPWTVDLWLYWDEKAEEYSKEPKTLHEYFENEYKEHKKYVEWKEWKIERLTPYQDVLIDKYFKEGFWLIAIVPRSKVALEPWTIEKNRLDRRGAMRWMLAGGNVAVVCGSRSNGLICIDIDKEPIPRIFERFTHETLTTKSQRGFHLYFRTDEIPRKFGDILHNKYGVECRYETQFALLPLSVHPKSTKKNIVFYDFVDYTKPILELEELLEVYRN
jgi:hypothetical protein